MYIADHVNGRDEGKKEGRKDEDNMPPGGHVPEASKLTGCDRGCEFEDEKFKDDFGDLALIVIRYIDCIHWEMMRPQGAGKSVRRNRDQTAVVI
jgi:hypothetical protein